MRMGTSVRRQWGGGGWHARRREDEIGTLGDGGKEQDGKSDREYGWRWRRMVVAWYKVGERMVVEEDGWRWRRMVVASYAHGMGGVRMARWNGNEVAEGVCMRIAK